MRNRAAIPGVCFGYDFPRTPETCCIQPVRMSVVQRDFSRLSRVAIMKISARTEYACIAMLELAKNYQAGGPVRIRHIAERHDVPPRFLVQILLQLKGAGLVDSVRGAAGGYRLASPPDEVSLGQVMEAVEATSGGDELRSAAKADSPLVKVLINAWRRVIDVQREMLHSISVSDLVEQSLTEHEEMYHI